LVEKFSNKVTKALYSNHTDPVGLVKNNERSVLTGFLAREYDHLEQIHQQYEPSRTSYKFLVTLFLVQVPSLSVPLFFLATALFFQCEDSNLLL